MKCCLAHILPSGHIVPFCAYNTLYRDGFVPLPPLADAPQQAKANSHAGAFVTPADSRRLAYGGFMLLALVVFLLARRVLPKPAGLAIAALVEAS